MQDWPRSDGAGPDGPEPVHRPSAPAPVRCTAHAGCAPAHDSSADGGHPHRTTVWRGSQRRLNLAQRWP